MWRALQGSCRVWVQLSSLREQMLLEWALPLGVASIHYFHIEMLCNSSSVHHLQIQPCASLQNTTTHILQNHLLNCAKLHDYVWFFKKGGFPLKTTVCAGGPPSGQRISRAQCVTCMTLIAHVTAGLLDYKLVISFWANIKLNSTQLFPISTPPVNKLRCITSPSRCQIKEYSSWIPASPRLTTK